MPIQSAHRPAFLGVGLSIRKVSIGDISGMVIFPKKNKQLIPTILMFMPLCFLGLSVSYVGLNSGKTSNSMDAPG